MKLKELRQIIREELNKFPKLKIGQEYQVTDPGTGETYKWEFVGFDQPADEYLFISRDASPDGYEINTLRIDKSEASEYIN
jgi:hypothetical protein